MRIMISPAKKMNVRQEFLATEGVPVFLEQTEKILGYLRSLSFEELKALWKCNDRIATENYRRVQEMDVRKNLTPAIVSYEGIQYQYMAPAVFEDGQVDYVQKHLRILSGFYGMVKPLDGVTPYRLEMQAKAPVDGRKDLYQFWGKRLYEEIWDGDRTLINLASKEYSKCIEAYLTPEDRMVTCVFGEWKEGKIVQKGTFAKMARGEMVRYLAEKQAVVPEDVKGFSRLGYQFCADHSTDTEYVFLKESKK